MTTPRGQPTPPGNTEQSMRVRQGPYLVERGNPIQLHKGILAFYHHQLEALQRHAENDQSLSELRVTLVPEETRMNCSGATTHNLVSHAIELTALYFYGPWSIEGSGVQGVTYEVFISLWEGARPEEDAVEIADFKSKLVVNAGDLMVVEIPHQVFIRPMKWYTIKFMLNGPDTGRMMQEPKTEAKIVVDNFGIIEFDFMTGSRQMPLMEFWIVTGEEAKMAEEQWIRRDHNALFQPRISFCAMVCEWFSQLIL